MTRTDFRALVAKGDEEANDLVREALGWKKAIHQPSGFAYWIRFTDGGCTCEVGMPPFATCPDSDPRSWALFGKMWDALVPERDTYERWPLQMMRERCGDIYISFDSGRSIEKRFIQTHAANRCAAIAEALLAALGKFDKE